MLKEIKAKVVFSLLKVLKVIFFKTGGSIQVKRIYLILMSFLPLSVAQGKTLVPGPALPVLYFLWRCVDQVDWTFPYFSDDCFDNQWLAWLDEVCYILFTYISLLSPSYQSCLMLHLN